MGMLFQFETLELRSICEDQGTAQRALASEADLLFAALADLRAISNLAELPEAILNVDLHALGVFYIIAGRHRVVFLQNHKVAPMDSNGRIDLSRVVRIRIVRIELHD
jgi:hypothetical protein